MSCASEDNAVQKQNERTQQQKQKRWQQQQPENGTAGERKQLIVHTMAAASKPQFSHSVPLNVKTLTATVAMVVDDATSPHIYNNIMHNENANDNGNNYSNFNSNCNCNSSGSIVGGQTNALQRIVLKQQHHHQQHCQTAQKLYAKAIYDNLADAPDELAFKKGDILTVIEQDTDGIQGWWLCTLRGRQGLCPGNRLRIVNSYDSGCFSPSPPSSPCPSLAASTATLNSSICSADIYENASIISNVSNCNNSGTNNCHQSQWHAQQQQQQNQRQGTRRSWHVSPNKVITPQRHGDVYIYNCPPSAASYHLQHSQRQSLQHLYQTPQQQQQQQQQIYSNQSIYQNRSVMANNTNGGATGGNDFETYDIPKPVTPINYDCPKNVVCRTPTTSTTMNNQFRIDGISLTMKSNNGVCSTPIQEESYDIPRPLNNCLLQQQNTMSPSSSNSSLLTSDSLSLSFSSSNRSSLANMPDYDVPRRNPLPVRGNGIQQLNQSHQQQRHSQQHSNQVTYDFPIPSCSSSTQSTPLQENTPQLLAANTTKELPLELSSALETLAKLQMESTTAITKLLSFVSPDWRVREKLEPVILDVKLAAVRLRTALHDLTEFGEGALGNATRSEDRTLALKLRPLVRALRDADKLIHESSEAVDAQGGWTVERLSRNDDKALRKPPDSLDQLIACVQTLIEDVRQTTSFIQGNASLLFKRSSSSSNNSNSNSNCSSNNSTADAIATPSAAIQTSTTELIRLDSSSETSNINTNGNTINSTTSEWLEDYDYVSFESKDAAAKKNSVLREAIQSNLKKKFDTVLKAAETNAVATATGSTGTTNKSLLIVGNSKKDELTDKDKLIVRYYAVQISTHMGNLRQAIDSFLETVEKNQPPKFFIAYGKFVVVSAHNLVMIGDIVHRNVSKIDLREKILACTNSLSDALKTCVTKSKKASAHFPSVTAVQEMVDSVVDISHLASDLKTSMLHAVQSSVM